MRAGAHRRRLRRGGVTHVVARRAHGGLRQQLVQRHRQQRDDTSHCVQLRRRRHRQLRSQSTRTQPLLIRNSPTELLTAALLLVACHVDAQVRHPQCTHQVFAVQQARQRVELLDTQLQLLHA